MKKGLYDAMIREVEKMLEGLEVDLLSVQQGVKKLENGVEEAFTRVEVEIPKGNGTFSRCRFSCKLPPIQLKVSEEAVEEGVSVVLSGVKVTFISTQKEIYTRADSVQLV